MVGDKKINFIIGATDQASATIGKVSAGLQGFASGAAALAGTIGFAKLASDFVEVNKQFQSLQASLVTVTGSSQNAGTAFKALSAFASSTPFQLTEVTQAFIKMQSLGLKPTEETLQSFGNTASAMGKSLNQMVEAVADATTGEFERLKEFGIKSKQQGDQVSFTFQGVTTTVAKSADAIKGYLEGIGNVQFAGAMEKQMNTLGGALSNLEDAYQTLLFNAGEAGGANDQLGESIRDLSKLLSAPSTVDALANMASGVAMITTAMVDMTVAMNDSIGTAAKWLAAYTVGDISLFDYVFTSKEEAAKRLTQIGLARDLGTGDLSRDAANMPPNPYALSKLGGGGGGGKGGGGKAGKFGLTDNAMFTGFDTGSYGVFGGAEQSPFAAYGLMTQSQIDEGITLLDDFYVQKYDLMAAWSEQEFLLSQEYYDLKLEQEQAYSDSVVALTEFQRSQKLAAFASAVQLLQMFGTQHKGAALAAIALEKGLRIGETWMSTLAAQMAAMAQLGPIAGPPAAAAIGAWGLVNMGLIAATGIAQGAMAGSGGGGGSINSGAGTFVSPTVTQPAQQMQSPPSREVNIIIYGNVVDHDKFAREIVPSITKAINDGVQ